VKEGKSGKWYAQVNDWKPSGGGMPQMPTFNSPAAAPIPSFVEEGDDSIPF